jgi:hypothetical protein
VELEIDINELRKNKVMVCTPMYGGSCTGTYTKSILDLAILATKMKLDFRFQYLFNESLITRARNYLCDDFLRSDCTHLMFIDSDIGFNADDVLMLSALSTNNSDKHVICGPYPKKSISWEKISRAVDLGLADDNPNNLEKYVGDYVFNPTHDTTEIRIDEPVEVMEGGTGFMLIQREALIQYRDAYPEFSYKPDHVRSKHFNGDREIHAFFDTVIDPDTKRYLSEDYMFCQWAHKIGLKIWLCPWMELTHTGTYTFGGSLANLAQIGAAPTADMTMRPV